MAEKHPTWTRSRVGRNRVRWVAYDDKAGAEGCEVVGEGYAASLPEADSAAREKLASLGMYQARRRSTSFKPAPRADREPTPRPARPEMNRPRAYVYSRREADETGGFLVSAHLIVKKTAKRVYVTRKSFGPDQLGSEDERWEENESTIPLDRLRLEQDGSVYSNGHRSSDFYKTRDQALGERSSSESSASRVLGLCPPFSLEDIKSAYRRKAFEAHPDRGGSPEEFQAAESAYRRLVREAGLT